MPAADAATVRALDAALADMAEAASTGRAPAPFPQVAEPEPPPGGHDGASPMTPLQSLARQAALLHGALTRLASRAAAVGGAASSSPTAGAQTS
jgi:hypothetical protein